MKIILKVLLLLCVSLSVSAQKMSRPPAKPGPGYGDNLQRYDDRSLLREMSLRGYQCDYQAPPQAAAQVLNILCDAYSYMNVDLYTEDGTKLTTAKYFLASVARCEKEKARIMAAAGVRLYKDKTIAFCDPYTYMVKIRVAKSAITESEKTFSASEANCNVAADQFNQLFNQ